MASTITTLYPRASEELVAARKVMDRWSATYPPLMRRLERVTDREPPFLSAQLFRATAELGGDKRPLIFAADRRGESISVLLLYRRRRTLLGLQSRLVPRFDLIGRGEGVEVLWRALRKERFWDLLRLRDVPESSPLVRELPELCETDGHRCRVRPGRHTVRFFTKGMEARVSRRLADAVDACSLRVGGASAELVTRRDDDAFDDALRLLCGDGRRGRGAAAPGRFYRALLADLADRDLLALSFLRVAGRRVAAQVGAEKAGTCYVLCGGRARSVDQECQALLLWEASCEAKQRGIELFDCFGLDLAGPSEWSPDGVRHVTLEIYRPSALGTTRYLLS